MQVAGSAYATSQPLYPYPNHYHHHHHPIPVAHDHELKRQYLTLLPPQQIIEICLAFDVHVPPYVKASIWPIDISAAIAGLQKQATASTQSQDGQDATKSPSSRTEEEAGGGGAGAIMDSLRAGPSEATPAPEEEQAKSKENVEEPRPPDKENKTDEPSSVGALTEQPTSVSSTASNAEAPSTTETETPSTSTTSSASTSTPTPTTNEAPPLPPPSAPPPATSPAVPPAAQAMSVAYPHQPYGYPYAPYYPPPPPGYPYPHHQYPAYPHQVQHAYPPHPPATAMAPVPPPPAPQMQILQEGQSPDDLPSYEEMIVEALMDSNDPEGCAPKDLFTWMAARYPVQSNFRPSASQALQKAFKRGRLEKSSNNKYRLNAAWEGGNTSRRTTRRPQTHGHTLNPASSSPFTNAPLVHNHHHQQQHQSHQQQQQGYPYASYPYPQGSYSSYAQQQTAPAAAGATPAVSQTQTQPTTAAPAASTSTTEQQKSADTAPSQDKEVNDAYEAAQNILKAINFGSLLQLPAEETQEGIAARASISGDASQAQNNAAGHQQPSAPPQTLLAALNGAQSAAPASTSVGGAQPSNSRADLQAQLALLAAQLAELARVDDGSSATVPGAVRPGHAPAQQQPAQVAPPVVRPQEIQQPKQQQQQFYQPSSAPPAPQQPVFNNSLYPYPHMQRSSQTQPQAPPPQLQPQPQPPAQPAVDNSAPMASLFPPPPPPPAQVPGPQNAQPQPQTAQQTQWSQSLMQLPHAQPAPQQQQPQPLEAPQQGKGSGVAPTASATAPTFADDHANVNGNALANGNGHEQHATSDGLAPLESMDTGLDGEYDSDDDDDDMEEVV